MVPLLQGLIRVCVTGESILLSLHTRDHKLQTKVKFSASTTNTDVIARGKNVSHKDLMVLTNNSAEIARDELNN